MIDNLNNFVGMLIHTYWLIRIHTYRSMGTKLRIMTTNE